MLIAKNNDMAIGDLQQYFGNFFFIRLRFALSVFVIHFHIEHETMYRW